MDKKRTEQLRLNAAVLLSPVVINAEHTPRSKYYALFTATLCNKRRVNALRQPAVRPGPVRQKRPARSDILSLLIVVTGVVVGFPLLQPFFRLLLSALFLHEPVAPGMVVCAGAIILCVAGAKRFA